MSNPKELLSAAVATENCKCPKKAELKDIAAYTGKIR